MGEDFTVWLNDASLPVGERRRLAELLARRNDTANMGEPVDLAGVDAEIATLVGELREYAEALGTWAGEGGR